MHRVVREKLSILLRELCREGFVVGDDKSRLADLFDNIGRGKRLARASHAKQGLMLHPLAHALDKHLNRLRLIARRRVSTGFEFEGGWGSLYFFQRFV